MTLSVDTEPMFVAYNYSTLISCRFIKCIAKAHGPEWNGFIDLYLLFAIYFLYYIKFCESRTALSDHLYSMQAYSLKRAIVMLYRKYQVIIVLSLTVFT